MSDRGRGAGKGAGGGKGNVAGKGGRGGKGNGMGSQGAGRGDEQPARLEKSSRRHTEDNVRDVLKALEEHEAEGGIIGPENFVQHSLLRPTESLMQSGRVDL